jgi:hypothetical protein
LLERGVYLHGRVWHRARQCIGATVHEEFALPAACIRQGIRTVSFRTSRDATAWTFPQAFAQLPESSRCAAWSGSELSDRYMCCRSCESRFGCDHDGALVILHRIRLANATCSLLYNLRAVLSVFQIFHSHDYESTCIFQIAIMPNESWQ